MRWIKTLFVHIQQWRRICPFEVDVKELELSARYWPKVTVFPSSEEGQRLPWIAGLWGRSLDQRVNGWQMFTEARLYFSDYKLGGGLYHEHRNSQLTPSPPRGTCGEYCPLLWQKQWASLSATFSLTRWPGCIVQGAQAKCGPLLPPIPSIFTSMSDCHPFIATGFLSAPCSRQLLSSYQQPGANRVQAVILEIGMQGVKPVHVVCVR